MRVISNTSYMDLTPNEGDPQLNFVKNDVANRWQSLKTHLAILARMRECDRQIDGRTELPRLCIAIASRGKIS